MKKRTPQKDGIPVMPICNFKKKTSISSFEHFSGVVVHALIALMKEGKGGPTLERIEKYIMKRYEVIFPNIRKCIQIILDRAIEMGYLTKECTNKKQIVYTFPFNSKRIPEFAYFMMQKIAQSLKKKRKKKKPPPDNKNIIL
ncbi:uncharacterized protein LOC123290411 [Chrysoperla carnea]|uniref:uncharacterized protein LOC123290411 n=1 Tax=Chrysoperla carnea TaxID=189513 RepID=UPI001D096F96|nr:uncharacterized protein LOC123290411 [Chrysoperla carnea]